MNDFVLFIGNDCWNNKVFCGDNDLASTSSKQECDCCEQSQYSSNLKVKQQPID